MNIFAHFFESRILGKGATLLALFLLPFRIQLTIKTGDALPFLQPWTTLYLTLSDIFLLLALISLGWEIWKKNIRIQGKPWLIPTVLALFFIGSSIAFLTYGETSIFVGWWRLFEIAAMYVLVIHFFSRPNLLLLALAIPLAFESVLATLQYLMQQSVGFFALGEPFIHPEAPGVAKIATESGKIIRAYGTFNHPNILGAFLVTATLGAAYLFSVTKKRRYLLILTAFVIGLAFTFSRTGILAVVIAMGFFIFFEKFHIKEMLLKVPPSFIAIIVGSITLAFIPLAKGMVELPLDKALHERWIGVKAAMQMMQRHPLGVGVTGFTVALPEVIKESVFPWDYQPVHNIFLLMSAELGVPIGITAIILLGMIGIRLLVHQRSFVTRQAHHMSHFALSLFVAFVILGSFDHLLWTDAQGRILLGLIFGIFSLALSKGRKVQKLKQEM